MSTSHGTGQPLWLKCSKCRKRISSFYLSTGKWLLITGTNLEATGKTRPVGRAQSGNGGCRVLQYQVQYRCLDCKHVGWTRHRTAERLLEKYRQRHA